MTVPLLELARTRPDAVALDDGTRTRTWAELVDRATRLGRLLRATEGIEPGDHVGLLCGNRVEFHELYLASMLSGVWFVPVNQLLAPDEVTYVLADSGARLVLADGDQRDLAGDLPVVTLGAELDGLLADASDEPFPGDGPSGARMTYTSGTTGHPKGVRRAKPASVDDMLASQAAGGRGVGLDGSGPHLVTGPAYHAAVGGYAWFDLVNGAPLVLMARFDAARTLELITERSIAHTHVVPTMCVRMLRLPDDVRAAFDPSSLTLVLHGAAPIAPGVKRQMIEWWGPVLREYWGASEAGTFTLVDSADWLAHPGTVGRATPGFEVFAVDDGGRRLPPNEAGTLYCHTAASAEPFRYHDAPEKTAAAYRGPGTFTLGDVGYVDDDGWVFLTDRATNMIISGGVNVYPAEVEKALVEHPAVLDVAVFGIPDDEWGESVKAVVELVPGTASGPDLEATLIAHARERLGRHKVPRSIDVVDRLPRQPNGKLYVRELRDPYWADHGRSI